MMTRCLQALSTDQDLQNRLRLELAQARLANGDVDLDHETLQSLPLLDGVVKESLRLYVAPSLSLTCLTMSDYRFAAIPTTLRE